MSLSVWLGRKELPVRTQQFHFLGVLQRNSVFVLSKTLRCTTNYKFGQCLQCYAVIPVIFEKSRSDARISGAFPLHPPDDTIESSRLLTDKIMVQLFNDFL